MNKKISLSPVWENVAQQIENFPLFVNSVEYACGIPPREKKIVMHDCYEFIYVKRGKINFCVMNNNVEVCANNMIIIKPQMKHAFTLGSSNCEFITICFTWSHSSKNQQMTESEISLSYFPFDGVDKLRYMDYILLRPGPRNDILNIVNKILREYDICEQWNNFIVGLYIMELFVHVTRVMRSEYELSRHFFSESAYVSMQRAKDYIDKNFNKEIGVSDVAKYVFLSESYFSHCFTQNFGISPKRYILEKRIASAKTMLAETTMSSGDISAAVGFSSPQRFNEIFRLIEGTTPTHYRADNKQKSKEEKV
ncbi:MAG: AraC family transcriptional regulator [Bacillota bacterium]|nr:AraC family transcriptional regulator [Bacillota bacterium]